LSTGATRLFVYATFDRPVTASGVPADNSGRQNVTGFLRFDAGAERTVEMRIATSLLSVEQAKRNLELEIAAGDSFADVKQRAQAQWDDKLGVIEIEGATQDQLVTFYSNLYRLFLYPNSGFENTGSADSPVYKYASPVSPKAGDDTPTQTGAEIVDGKVYVNNGFWDTYRTTWPAYALFTPEMAGELVDGFVQQYRDGGWISRWSSPGYANLMVGTSSDVAFADAYLKGVGGFDVKSAYEAAVKNASVAPPTPNVGRKGLSTSIFLGYTTTDTGEGMSWAMDGYINDFGISNLAKALAESSDVKAADRKRYKEEAEYYRNRALNYVNMFDKSVGFFQGRKPDGSWRLPTDEYDPAIWGYDYTETNGWNMAFHVPHDGQGLANLYGGKAKLAAKLDSFFSTPETGSADIVGSYGGIIHEMIEARDVRMGMFGFSNQPAHHIAYMYDYAGQPWKTQEKVREVLSRLYLGSEIGQGYPGDEDNGEMSAWQVFSALGFYPLQMGSPYYAVGSPLFKQATVNLPNGRSLVIKAPSNSARNIYVQGLKVNGKRYSKTYLPHDLLARGGVLEFELGSSPSRWGTGSGSAPPSLTSGSRAPRPLADLTGVGAGTPATPEVAQLFDNTSTSHRTLDGSAFDIGYVLDKPAKAAFYTLTSSPEAGDPRSWVLEGSTDGKKWTALDRRDGEVFDWRLQTRPFKVEKPGTFSHYRIRVTENTGEATTSLAEVELLG
jgi:predicted alpha-1,2-mannosidase